MVVRPYLVRREISSGRRLNFPMYFGNKFDLLAEFTMKALFLTLSETTCLQ